MLFASRPRVIAHALAVLSLSLVHACSESTPADPSDTSATPRTGSTYRYHRYQADTSGTPIAGSSDTALTTLVNVSAQYEGQSSVHVFVHAADTLARLRYVSNGDVLYYPSWSRALGSGWLTLPVASRGTTQRTLRDTVVDLGGGESGRSAVTLSITYESSEQIGIPGDTMQVHRISMQIVDRNPLTAELALVDTTRHTVWYAPRLGYFARQEIARSRQHPYATDVFPTEVRVLTGYELK